MTPRDMAEYVAEFTPTHGKPLMACRCGDRVFYQLAEFQPWLCRSCHPLGTAGWRSAECRHRPLCEPPKHVRSAVHRWFVVLERRP
jgi:hypothetical protein